jgi:hypothetical protein
MRIFKHKIKKNANYKYFRSHESKQTFFTSTTEIAARVVEKLNKPIQVATKRKAYSKKRKNRILLKEAMGKQNSL